MRLTVAALSWKVTEVSWFCFFRFIFHTLHVSFFDNQFVLIKCLSIPSSLPGIVGGHLNAFNGRRHCGRRLRALTVKMPKLNTCKNVFRIVIDIIKTIYPYRHTYSYSYWVKVSWSIGCHPRNARAAAAAATATATATAVTLSWALTFMNASSR